MVAKKLEQYKKNLLIKRTEKLNKDFIFLEGCAKFSKTTEFEIALHLSKKYHNWQVRSSWEPYLSHVIDVTIELLNRWIKDSQILSCAILHDILEDCGEFVSKEFLESQGIESKTVNAISCLTKEKGYDHKQYYEGIKINEISCIVKLADRLHNLWTMSWSFNVKKIEKYIKETKEYIIPIAKYARKNYIHNSSIIMSLKRDIERLITTIEILFLEHGIDLDISYEENEN